MPTNPPRWRRLAALLFLSTTLTASPALADDQPWTPPDPGPQYSDESLASAFREEQARRENAAEDIRATREDVAGYAEDGTFAAEVVQASGIAKVVESVADGAMAIMGELAGPAGEGVDTLYGQAKGITGAVTSFEQGQDAQAWTEIGKAVGETVGAESTLNRASHGAAAIVDVATGEYLNAAGNAWTAVSDDFTGSLVQAEAGVVEGLVRYAGGVELEQQIESHAAYADANMAAQEQAIREQAAAYGDTAQMLDGSAYDSYDSGYDSYDSGYDSYDVGSYDSYESYDSYDTGYDSYDTGSDSYDTGYDSYDSTYDDSYDAGNYGSYDAGYEPYISVSTSDSGYYDSYDSYDTGSDDSYDTGSYDTSGYSSSSSSGGGGAGAAI